MAAGPLVTTSQVLERLGRPFTASENIRIAALIADVSAAIRSPGGTAQQITASTSTDLVRVTRNNTAILPQRPVTAITAVVDELYANVLSYTWSTGEPQIDLDSSWYLNAWELNLRQTGRHRNVRVTYTHGYSTTPDDIVAVACAVIIRALVQDPDSVGGIIQESIAGYSYSLSVTLAEAANARAFGLLDEERKILDGYRRPAGAISLSQ